MRCGGSARARTRRRSSTSTWSPTRCTRTSRRSTSPAGSSVSSPSCAPTCSGGRARSSSSRRAGPPICSTPGPRAGRRCARRFRRWRRSPEPASALLGPARRAEADDLVRAVAERPHARLPAAAQRDRAPADLDLVAVLVGEAARAAHQERRLEARKLLVPGVLTESSIAFSIARRAQEEGAELVLTGFGRGLRITQRVARRLPSEPDVLELDVNDPEQLETVAQELAGRWGRLDGLVHAIAFVPSDALGGNFLTA